MKLGKEIAQIRKDNSMTQEAFGQIFHITRQTVSNWENEKSYPDLETLVAISDRFGISLDTLLKEDEHMIQTIDKERRRGKRLLKIVIAALSVVVIACASYSGYWYYQKASFEERFESTLARYDFTQMTAIDEAGNESFSGRYGSQQPEGYFFIEPPDFPSLLSFNTTVPDDVQSMYAIINVDGHKILRLYIRPAQTINNSGEISTDFAFTTIALVDSVKQSKDGTIEWEGSQEYRLDEDGNLEALEAAPEADFLDAYEAHKSDIRSAVSTMREMLNAFYA